MTAVAMLTHVINRFILVLLACQVIGEWVEISQNHYRKVSLPSRRVSVSDEEPSPSQNKIFANYSVTERSWNRGVVTRIPNVGNVRRVQLPGKLKNEVVSNSTPKSYLSRQYVSFNSDRLSNVDYEMRENQKKNEKSDSKVKTPSRHMNPGVGSIHLTTQTVFKEGYNNYKETNSPNDHKRKKVDTNTSLSARNPNIKSIQTVSNIGKIKQVKVTKLPNTDLKNNLKANSNSIDTNLSNSNSNEKTHIGTPTNDILNKVGSARPQYPSLETSAIKNGPELKKYVILDEENTRIKNNNSTKVFKEENFKQWNQDAAERYEHDGFENGQSINNTKTNSVNAIWKFMKVVTDNVSRNTRRSFRSKTKYLEGLRNNILANIEERIEQAWPDDGRSGSRSKRSARGHVEFPSSEGALMTISFLTFAVFLIKLVLQVIHTYKNKTMMVTPTVVAAVGRAVVVLKEQTQH